MRVIWRKVWRDIWGHKSRAAMLVINIAVGVFSIGLPIGILDFLHRHVQLAGRTRGDTDFRSFAREGGTLFHANATTLLVVMLLLSSERLASFAQFILVGLVASALTILTTPPLAGSVFAFTNAGAGQYPFVPFSFPPSVAKSASGQTFDAVVILFDATGNIVDVSNADRVTLQ